MTEVADVHWAPGDPVYPDERVVTRQHCGPCEVSWTTSVERCPECGRGSAEALREAALTLVGHVGRMLDDWAELSHVPEQRNRELWTPLHDKADRLGGLLEAQ